MKVAIVSSDRVNVDGHFGKANRFLIYEVKGEGPVLLEKRPCRPLSVDDRRHPFDPERFDRLLEVLAGCEKIFVSHIGRTPAAQLRMHGIEPVVYQGPIGHITE